MAITNIDYGYSEWDREIWEAYRSQLKENWQQRFVREYNTKRETRDIIGKLIIHSHDISDKK